MSTRASIIYSASLDNDFHIYHEMLDDKYYLQLDGQEIKIKKSTVKKMLRDFKRGKIMSN
jgi:hypothetical protein